MRKSLFVLSTLLLTINCLVAQPTPKSSPATSAAPMNSGSGRLSSHETANARIDGDAVLLVYGRPHIKDPKSGGDRTVWGGQLVPSDQIWRTGADEATLLVTQKPLVFGNTTVPAGIYSLFTYYAADGSAKLVVNKKNGQWGIGRDAYDSSQDLVQVAMKKTDLDNQVEQFTMAVEKDPAGGGMIKMMWATTQFSVPFTVAK